MSVEPSSSIGQAGNWHAVNKEARSRLLTLDIGELRQQWRGLYKTQAPRHFSRELLVQAVAYRLQELARGGLRPQPQRQLRRIAQEIKDIGAATIRARSNTVGSGRLSPFVGNPKKTYVVAHIVLPQLSGQPSGQMSGKGRRTKPISRGKRNCHVP
jgi:Protein of unknown function (DUF2924)